MPNTALSCSLWVARPWPTNSFKRMVPTAVQWEPISCSLPGEWLQQLFVHLIKLDCCRRTMFQRCLRQHLRPSKPLSSIFIFFKLEPRASLAQTYKQQGWQSEAVAPSNLYCHCIRDTQTGAKGKSLLFFAFGPKFLRSVYKLYKRCWMKLNLQDTGVFLAFNVVAQRVFALPSFRDFQARR